MFLGKIRIRRDDSEDTTDVVEVKKISRRTLNIREFKPLERTERTLENIVENISTEYKLLEEQEKKAKLASATIIKSGV